MFYFSDKVATYLVNMNINLKINRWYVKTNSKYVSLVRNALDI